MKREERQGKEFITMDGTFKKNQSLKCKDTESVR
jgi:hypothetical protein